MSTLATNSQQGSYIMMGSAEEMLSVQGWTGNHVLEVHARFYDPATELPQSW